MDSSTGHLRSQESHKTEPIPHPTHFKTGEQGTMVIPNICICLQIHMMKQPKDYTVNQKSSDDGV
jgi:hypothetical protein